MSLSGLVEEHMNLNPSICTANVNSLHRAPDGHAGKVQYLREQFKRLHRVVHKTPRILLVRGDSAYWTGWLLVHMAVFRWAQENSSGRISVKLPINVATQSSPMSSWTTTHLQELLMGVMFFCDGLSSSSSTRLLRGFLEAHDLCLPSTSDIHEGSRTTWVSADGNNEHCISESQQPYKNDARCRKWFLSSIWDMEIGTTQPPA